MSEGTAERGVVFVLKAQTDSQAKQIIESFAKDLQAAQKQLDTSIVASAQSSVSAIEQVTRASSAAQEAAIKLKERELRESLVEQASMERASLESRARILEEQTRNRTEAAKEFEKLSLSELYAAREKIHADKFAKEEAKYIEALQHKLNAEQAYDQLIGAAQEQLAETGRALAKEEIDLLKQVEKVRNEAVREAEAASKRWTTVEEQENQRRLNSAIVTAKAIAKTNEDSAAELIAAHSKVERSLEGMRQAFGQALTAAGQLGKGLTMLGLVGEKDVQKLTDTLLTMQGTLDTLQSMWDLVSALEKGYKLWTAATLAQVAAEKLLRDEKSKSFVGPMQPGMNIPGAGSVAGGVAGWAASQAARLAPYAWRIAGGAGMAGGIAGATYVAGDIGDKAGSIIGSSNSLEDLNVGARNAMINWATYGYADQWVLTSKTSAQQKQEEFAKRNKEQLDSLSHKNAHDSIDQGYIDAANERRTAALKEQALLEERMLAAQYKALSTTERRGAIAYEISRAEKDISNGIESGYAKSVEWLNRRLENEKAIHDVQRKAAADQLTAAQSLLEKAKTRLEQEKSAYLSSKERFGLMSSDEQKELLGSVSEFRRNGANMSSDQLKKLQGTSTWIDQKIKEEALKRATIAGFDQVIGAEAAQEISKLEREIKTKLEVDVKAKADVIVRLDADYNAIATQVNAQIQAKWGAMMNAIAERIKQQESITNEIQQRMTQRATNIVKGP